jgi:hypothetical protein
MSLRLLLLVLGLTVFGRTACAEAPSDSTSASDPKAIAVADRVIRALGGKERFDALRGLQWSFESARNDTVLSTRLHTWSKWDGRYKVSGTTRDGVPFTFTTDLDTGEGQAWMAGAPMAGDTMRALMKRAKSLWTNDSYWLLMPFKLRDPGVVLKHEGTVREGDYLFDKLALSFEGVGETPGDHYWIYVNQASGRPEKWEYVLQGQHPPPAQWRWEGWEQHGGLWFATAKRGPDGRTIYTRRIATMDEMPDAELQGP